MATELGSAYISVGLGTNKLGPEIKKAFSGIDADAGAAGESAGKSFQGKFSGFMKSAAVPALGALAGIGLMAKGMGDLAATAEQNMGAVETVFTSAAGGVAAFAANSANSVGLSASSYNELSAVTGTALKSAGVSVDELAAKNDALITRGADMASVFGGTTADAVGAMGAAFRGEFDTLEQFGVNLTAEAINAELAARGQDKLGGAALEAAKKQATMDLIMQKSAVTAGNFAKESDTAAGAQQRSAAAWEDASAKLGEQLLPIMTAVATKVSELSTWIGQNTGLVTGLAIGVGVLAAAIGVWSVVQGILNLVMLASPITWVILGIIALIAAVVALVMNWQTVVTFITAIWGGFIGWITGVIGGFVGFWNASWAAVGQFISDVWNNIVSWVTGAFNNVWSTISSILGTIQGIWNSAWSAVGAKIGEVWEGIKTGVSDGINNVVTFVTGLKDKVLSAVAGAATWLVDSGKSLIQGFLDGIGQIDIGGAIGGVLQSIRDFFPFSPAKKGPFSGRGYTTYSGAALAGDFAKGIGSQESLVSSAASSLMSAASLSGMRAPGLAAVSSGSALAGAGGSPIYVQNPFTGEYLLARVGSVASGAVQSADSNSRFMRAGR